jgi:hypothetical protein
MRPADFDPYNDWLGIPPHDQPPDHYRLLGLARFERDPIAIQKATDGRMAHVRRYQTGPRGHYTQELLNQLAAAKLTLLDEGARAAYDSSLRERQPRGAAPVSPAWRASRRTSHVSLSPGAAAERGIQQTSPASRGAFPGGPAFSPAELKDDQDREPGGPLYRQSWFLIVTLLLLATAGVLAIGLQRILDEERLDLPQVAEQPELEDQQPPAIGQNGGTRTVATDGVGTLVQQEGDRSVNLTASTALLRGDVQLVRHGDQCAIANWTSPECSASWRFVIFEKRDYHAKITYAVTADARDHSYTVQAGGQSRKEDLSLRGGPGVFITDEFYLVMPRTGEHTLVVRTDTPTPQGLMELKSLRLTPVR